MGHGIGDNLPYNAVIDHPTSQSLQYIGGAMPPSHQANLPTTASSPGGCRSEGVMISVCLSCGLSFGADEV